MKIILIAVFNTILTFLGPVWNSVKGKINFEEFIKVVVLSFSTSTSLFSALVFIYTHISQFVTDPMTINLITGIVGVLTFAIDYFRRKNHGEVKHQASDIRVP